jgi:hypothetical protein
MKARLDKGAQVAARIRQALPVIPLSYSDPIDTRVIDTLDWIGEERETECYGDGWSNAQHCRKEAA